MLILGIGFVDPNAPKKIQQDLIESDPHIPRLPHNSGLHVHCPINYIIAAKSSKHIK